MLTEAARDSILDVISRDDSLHVALICSFDVSTNKPENQDYVIFRSSATAGKEPYLYLGGATYIVPTGFTMEAVWADSIKFTWNDIYTGEDGYIVLNAADSSAVSDTLAANSTTVTIGGYGPDELHECIVMVIDYTDDYYGVSVSDDEATYPANVTGLVTTRSANTDTLHYTFAVNSNPATTKYAALFIDSDGDSLWADFSATTDSLRTSNGGIDSLYTWGWQTRANIIAFSDTALIYIPDHIGKTLTPTIFSQGQDDGD